MTFLFFPECLPELDVQTFSVFSSQIQMRADSIKPDLGIARGTGRRGERHLSGEREDTMAGLAPTCCEASHTHTHLSEACDVRLCVERSCAARSSAPLPRMPSVWILAAGAPHPHAQVTAPEIEIGSPLRWCLLSPCNLFLACEPHS